MSSSAPEIEVRINGKKALEAAPFKELENHFPNRLVVIQVGQNLFTCMCFNGFQGLCCFTTVDKATDWFRSNFSSALWITGVCVEVSLDEARDIAKSRVQRQDCLFLLEDFLNPEVHWLR